MALHSSGPAWLAMLGAAGQELALDDYMWGKLAVLTRTFGIEP